MLDIKTVTTDTIQTESYKLGATEFHQPTMSDSSACSCWCYSVHSIKSALISSAHFTTIVTHFLKLLRDMQKTCQKVEKVLFQLILCQNAQNLADVIANIFSLITLIVLKDCPLVVGTI